MPAIEGILGPGMSENDINLELPNCVKLVTPVDNDEFRAFADKIVRATMRNAVTVLRNMLAQTPNAQKLADDFAARLGA